MNRAEFIHISDIHYQNEYSPISGRLISKTGVTFIEQFLQGMAYIQNRFRNIDFFLVSGDLVHEGGAEEYRELKEMWADICDLPVYTVPGNHDRDSYGHGFLETSDAPPFDSEYIHPKSGLRILALDSRGGQYESGFLSSEQLSWLKERLSRNNGRGNGRNCELDRTRGHDRAADYSCECADNRNRDTILLLHHTPHVSGEIEFLTYQMENPQELYEVVKDSNILAIFCGHTHRHFLSTLGNIPCYTVNSITHEIHSDIDSMTLSNKTGFNHCIYEEGILTVQHICVPQEAPAEITMDYTEFEENAIC